MSLPNTDLAVFIRAIHLSASNGVTRVLHSSPEKTSDVPKRRSLIRLLKQFYVPHWRWFAGGTAFAVITALAAAAYIPLVYYVTTFLEGIDGTDAPANVPTLLWFGILGIAAMAALRALSLYAMTVLNNSGVQYALVDIQDAQFASLTEGDFARLSGEASGGYVSRFINDVNAIRDSGLRLANNFTKSIVTVIASFAGMLIINWQLTLVLLVAYPLAFGPVIALGNRVRKRSKRAQRQVGEVTSLLSEGFQSARIVKAYGLESYQKDRAQKGFLERSILFLKVLKDKAAVDPILEITGGLAIAGIFAFTAWQISNGDTSIGALLAIVTALGIASPELRALGTLNAVAQEGAAAADRVYDVLDEAPRIADVPGALKLLKSQKPQLHSRTSIFPIRMGPRRCEDLASMPAPGETVALVGPSGAGKSTVFNLLLRLYDASAGRVAVNGTDIRDVTAASLRAQTALVAQDAALFDDTIGANIALGKIGASGADIQAAAEAANAHEFVVDLPGAYSAPCGEGGGNLSGGQRQRIALARAILRGAPILLLDEATSALDAESEAKVQASLDQFTEGRTTLVIAHRLSTVRAADKIIVIEDGRAVEQGSHEELLAANGAYARLAKLQLS